ncbi:MAG: hypothetical protein ACE5IH_09335 [Thermodesulfobacteriota bacterium]
MRKFALLFIFLVILVVLVGRSSVLLADEGVTSIAIFPFENISDFPGTHYIILDHLNKELGNTFSLVPQDKVEDFLASRRIRYTGGINRLNARLLRKELSADTVLLGSTDLFVESANDIYVGLTFRLVSTLNGSIVWADSISYAGKDFAGILGLGRVASLDELTSIVVKELVKSFPLKDVTRKLASIPQNSDPYELEKVVVEPSIGRMGEKIDITLKILSIADAPLEVKGTWNGTKVTFRRFEDGEYRGSTVFSEEEGIHHLDIFITDKEKNTFPFYSVARILVDNTPPVVELDVGNKIFSPKMKGYTSFSPGMLSLDDISEWSMEILNDEGKRVRGDRGYDNLPKALIWRGENDANMWVEDGQYTYKFVVKDTAGNETTISDTIKVKSRPPQINVDIDVVEERLIFLFDSGSEEDVQSWKLTLLDKEGKEVRIIEGEGNVPPILNYPITGSEQIDTLSFSFTATDVAGNIFKTFSSIPSILFKKSPFTNIPFTKRMNGKGFMIEDF